MIASIFSADYEYRHLSSMKSFRTLDTDGYIPQMISNDTITLKYTNSTVNSSMLLTTIEWAPTKGE